MNSAKHENGGPNQDRGIFSWFQKKKENIEPSKEPPKPVLTRSTPAVISWHFWTIAPCFVTGVLLGLNFSNFSIGREIGTTPENTSIILAIIQLCSKAHEILMVLGLLNIAQQAIQRAMTKGGTLLGLMGAEGSLSNVLFIFSQEFRVAFSYSLRSRGPKQKKIRQLVALIIIVCSLCTVVGPASAVLMVPKLNLFYEQSLEWNNTASSICYPYIMLDPRLGSPDATGRDYMVSNIFTSPYPSYWLNLSPAGRSDLNTSEPGSLESEGLLQQSHHYSDFGIPVAVNTSSTMNRVLNRNGNWQGPGGTNFSTVTLEDTYSVALSLHDYKPRKRYEGAVSRFVTDMTGMFSQTTCRSRDKLRYTGFNSSDFYFKSVHYDTDEGSDIHSNRLLLLYERTISHYDDHESSQGDASRIWIPHIRKIWVTEGLMEKSHIMFTDTILIVLEDDDLPNKLTVCSNVVALKSVKATSSKQLFDPDLIQVNSDNYSYFHPTEGSNSASVTRNLLYHEGWLDSIYFWAGWDPELNIYPNMTTLPYPPRNMSKVTPNFELEVWAEGLAQFPYETKSSLDPSTFELAVGGAFIEVISRTKTSPTQYSSVFNTSILSGSGMWDFLPQQYPDDLMIEPSLQCQRRNGILEIYHDAYGYQWRTISKILSMAVLLLHCLVAILGSFWQWYRGSIIKAWGTVAEYVTLGLGSDPGKAAPANTCAGIRSKETLGTFVGVRETPVPTGGGTEVKHLELTILHDNSSREKEIVKLGMSYGAALNKSANVEVKAVSSSAEPTEIRE